MKAYDPSKNPQPSDWLSTDEGERIYLVELSHRRARVRLPNRHLHATVHVIVENQLAMAVPAVTETLTRLRAGGLDRHDAIHAIGSVLAGHIYDLLEKGPAQGQVDPNVKYYDGLRNLTAATWRKSS